MYTWLQFKDAVDDLLLVNADREGTNTTKALWVRQAVLRIQRNIEKYRKGQQNIYTPGNNLTQNGLASSGSLPEDCEPRDCFILREHRALVSSAVDLVTDQITVMAHGVTAGTETTAVQRGWFLLATGATGPTPIVAGATYYLRVVDADTLTLHTTAEGALDNTDRVDLDAAWTGIVTLIWGQQRFPCDTIPWKDRHSLIYGQVCVNDQHGVISLDPNGLTFLVFPRLQLEDVDGLFHTLELNWDGVKIAWVDSDLTPFDEQATDVVAEFVQARFYRHVDRDLPAAVEAQKAAKDGMAGAHLDAKRRGELKFK